MIFETHAHYDDAKFDTDREMLLAELPQRGISPVINAGSVSYTHLDVYKRQISGTDAVSRLGTGNPFSEIHYFGRSLDCLLYTSRCV